MARPVTPAQRAAQITFVLSASLRAIRRRLAALPAVSPALIQELDVLLDHLKAATGAVARASRPANAGVVRISAIGVRSLRG
jgi:hypothetical protein